MGIEKLWISPAYFVFGPKIAKKCHACYKPLLNWHVRRTSLPTEGSVYDRIFIRIPRSAAARSELSQWLNSKMSRPKQDKVIDSGHQNGFTQSAQGRTCQEIFRSSQFKARRLKHSHTDIYWLVSQHDTDVCDQFPQSLRETEDQTVTENGETSCGQECVKNTQRPAEISFQETIILTQQPVALILHTGSRTQTKSFTLCSKFLFKEN